MLDGPHEISLGASYIIGSSRSGGLAATVASNRRSHSHEFRSGVVLALLPEALLESFEFGDALLDLVSL